MTSPAESNNYALNDVRSDILIQSLEAKFCSLTYLSLTPTCPQTMGLTPAFSKRLLTFIQDAMPLRLKEVHFVKQPMIFNVVWNMFKPFIREKLKNRVSSIHLAALHSSRYIVFFWVHGKSSNHACCSGWSGRQCQTSTD